MGHNNWNYLQWGWLVCVLHFGEVIEVACKRGKGVWASCSFIMNVQLMFFQSKSWDAIPLPNPIAFF